MNELLKKIKNELFTQNVRLTKSDAAYDFGRATYMFEVFYYEHQYGYFLYVPVRGISDRDTPYLEPINPTSFRWAMFNRQIIFVPTKPVPFNTVFRIHPDLDDYIINFNLEYYTRYKRCFVEASDPNVDFYFLIRRPKDYIVDFETMQLDPDMVDAENLRDALINNSVETRKVIALPVMPEFNASRDILKVITSENLNDIWRHWLAAQYGDRLLNPSENYYSRCVHDNWVDDVVGHLVLQNMIEARKPSELDPGLKRLLGI